MPSDPSSITYVPGKLDPDPLLTIVTPLGGDRDLLAETARSLQGQSFQEWEWLIVEDASRHEEARQALRESGHVDPRIRFVDDLRKAVSQARSDFILEIKAGDV